MGENWQNLKYAQGPGVCNGKWGSEHMWGSMPEDKTSGRKIHDAQIHKLYQSYIL